MSYEVRRYHDISCGHRVYNHEGKCAHLHGHNYRVHFLCEPDTIRHETLDKVGRVIDFAVINELLCQWLELEWDHRFLIWDKDPWYMKLYAFDQTVRPVPFNPTAENMAKYLVDHIGPLQLSNSGVRLREVMIEETRKCWASYRSQR